MAVAVLSAYTIQSVFPYLCCALSDTKSLYTVIAEKIINLMDESTANCPDLILCSRVQLDV